VHPEKGLLDDLSSVVLVADEADRDRESAPLVPLDQRAKRALFSGLGSNDESTIFLGFP